MSDLFERLSEGRFVSLSAAPMTGAQIEMMANCPFRACVDCMGTGLAGLLMAADDEGQVEVLMPLPCPECEGSGMVAYATYN